jgi:hypothetical protein
VEGEWTVKDFIESSDRSIQEAGKWRAKGNLGGEMNCLEAGIKDGLRYVLVTGDADGVERVLMEIGVIDWLKRSLVLNEELLKGMHGGKTPTAGVGDLSMLAQVAIYMRQMDVARRMIEIGDDPLVLKHFPVTGFWKEYRRGVACLMEKKAFWANGQAAKGYQKYFLPYLSLMEAVTRGEDRAEALAAIGESFRARNRDKRLTDWDMIDGDGKHPVSWDFRLAVIERAITAAEYQQKRL